MSSGELKVLVVEDITTMRRLVLEMLRMSGITQVAEAMDGKTALDLLRSQSFDLVVSDLTMRGGSGLALLQAMRADPALADIPFVMMTGEHTPEFVTHAMESGTSYYLVKPFARQDLLTAMQKAMLIRQAA